MTLTIRRAEAADAASIHAIFCCPSVIRQSLQLPFPSVAEWRKRLTGNDANSHLLLACDAAGQVLAAGGIHREPNPRRQHAGSLFLVVHEAHQGHGVGRALLDALLAYADDWLGLVRLELVAYPDNLRAISLYESVGFEREGVLRQEALRDGRYEDGLLMARLRGPERSAA